MRSNSIQASTVQGTKTPCLPRIPRMPRICLGYGSSVQTPFKPTLSKMLVNLKCVSTKGCWLFANAKQLFHLVKFSSWLSQTHSQGVAYSQMAPCCTKNPILRWAGRAQMGILHQNLFKRQGPYNCMQWILYNSILLLSFAVYDWECGYACTSTDLTLLCALYDAHF